MSAWTPPPSLTVHVQQVPGNRPLKVSDPAPPHPPSASASLSQAPSQWVPSRPPGLQPLPPLTHCTHSGQRDLSKALTTVSLYCLKHFMAPIVFWRKSDSLAKCTKVLGADSPLPGPPFQDTHSPCEDQKGCLLEQACLLLLQARLRYLLQATLPDSPCQPRGPALPLPAGTAWGLLGQAGSLSQHPGCRAPGNGAPWKSWGMGDQASMWA